MDDKSRQRHYWGSRTWIRSFARRSRVEGWFGNLKDCSREALGRGAFRVMGLCKSSLMLGIFAVATNLRLLAGWARRSGAPDPFDTSEEPGDFGLDPDADGFLVEKKPSSHPPPGHASDSLR